ncbi:MAG: ribulose-phosphate 3-epimerase [Bacteroidia bacterium]|nr:ribulose-phosphate 3-epimerase [Bacteroidia bacterium]MCZ2249429.1 ribulose-phosphate 3-epimerase [Bacteroidia bacterium]
MLIAPSVLSANFGQLDQEIEMINSSSADWFHVDVMDGVFVPNISFGFPVLKQIKKRAHKPIDVHLMIVEPQRYIDEFCIQGADSISVHLEACTHLHRTIQQIKSLNIKAGVAINPHTPIHSLIDIISDIDLVCLMSVNPGFGGQKFIANTYKKVKELKELIIKSSSKALIEIDGGVDFENAPLLKEAGADVLVAGNTVFSHPQPSEAIARLKNT